MKTFELTGFHGGFLTIFLSSQLLPNLYVHDLMIDRINWRYTCFWLCYASKIIPTAPLAPILAAGPLPISSS